MSGTAAPVQVEVWTLAVGCSDSRYISVGVYGSELEGLEDLKEMYDPEGEFETPIPDNPKDYDEWVDAFALFADLQHVEVDKHVTNAVMVDA